MSKNHRKKTSEFKDSSQDQIYVVESLVQKKVEKAKVYWKVKWLGFPEESSTWEPSTNIQPWIMDFYETHPDNLGKSIPDPVIKYSKKSGGETFHYLSWGESDTGDLPQNKLVGDNFFSIASEDGELVSQLDSLSCNTKKTKDKRERRHTVGILVGTKPCGTVVLFDELYGSESLTQVYGNLVEYLAKLSEESRNNLRHICYDDACHFWKFCKNMNKKKSNEFTKFLSEIPMSIDKFHFRNHVDTCCRQNCDPYKARELDGVNTESCEQTFKWVNKFTAVKSMSGPRFWMFFTILFDLHNLSIQGKLIRYKMASPGPHP